MCCSKINLYIASFGATVGLFVIVLGITVGYHMYPSRLMRQSGNILDTGEMILGKGFDTAIYYGDTTVEFFEEVVPLVSEKWNNGKIKLKEGKSWMSEKWKNMKIIFSDTSSWISEKWQTGSFKLFNWDNIYKWLI